MENPTVSLKEHIEKLLEEKDRANNQRFLAQEEAIKTAERNRDTAIKKAEDSIEKKSDIAYVKISDLQTTLSEVMRRPEIESRFKGMDDKVDNLKESRDEGKGKDAGWVRLVSVASFIGTIIAIYLAINK